MIKVDVIKMSIFQMELMKIMVGKTCGAAGTSVLWPIEGGIRSTQPPIVSEEFKNAEHSNSITRQKEEKSKLENQDV